jgi:exosortase D (VPLPA-CTERM-specific)
MTSNANPTMIWKEPLAWWISLIGLGAVVIFVFFDGLKELLRVWEHKEEYSYGYMIPVITAFLIWQRKDQLERMAFTGSWAGVALMFFGLCVFLLGELSGLFLLVQYAFLLVVAGLALALTGWPGFRLIAVPLLLLAFMVPLPQFFLAEISAQLQLISSQIGVGFIRLFGISVNLEGNVIDLGAMKLQVVEACSGLRYLFPLMTLGFIAAYFFKGAFWKRAVIFLSTIPITVIMNSLRIGAIGVMVEYWGKAMAEGFLHDFEGWVVFMACTAVLVGEMWVLARLGARGHSLQEAFGLDFPAPTPKDALVQQRALPRPFLAASLLAIIAAGITATLPQRVEATLARQEFSRFPMTLGEWQGKSDRIAQIYLNELKLDDHVIADFTAPGKLPINFYVAYYASQKKGQSAHSPRTCLPGGGWRIISLTQHEIDGLGTPAGKLRVNRSLIQMGEHKQLVYYWFQQRGRNLTNEYLVKWYIFWDALTRNRTDGALVRLTMPVPPNLDLAEADKQLGGFVKLVNPLLSAYVPE